MLQVGYIRNNVDLVKKKLALKNFGELSIVDQVLELDDQRKKLQLENDNTLSSINNASKQIGQLMAKGQKDEAEKMKREVASLKGTLAPVAEKLAAVEK